MAGEKKEDIVSAEVSDQFERIYDDKDKLDQKVTSFIGFIALLFGLLFAVVVSSDLTRYFNDENIWTLYLALAIIFVNFLIALICAFSVIYGFPIFLGLDLVQMDLDPETNVEVIKKKVTRGRISLVISNIIRYQKIHILWQIAVFTTFIIVISLGFVMMNTYLMSTNPDNLILGYGLSILTIFIEAIGIIRIWYKGNEIVKNWEEYGDDWTKVKKKIKEDLNE